MKQFLLVLFIVPFHYLASAQADQSMDCSILKKGTFKYVGLEDTTAYFTIKKSNHVEYHEGGKYQIKSKLKWLNPCQYQMEMLSNTIPDFPFKPGDVMLVTINKIEGNTIYYTSEVNKQTWDGVLKKIE